MFATLIVIDDPMPHTAALNMALDETLLVGLDDVAVLRCYRWMGRPVSFGCFGKIDMIRKEYPGRTPVRRWTGGGIVEHGDDFTFSLLIPRHLSPATLKPSESYQLIHGAVASALTQAGLQRVESAQPPDADGDHAPTVAPHLKTCFDHPVANDLLIKGRKVVGGAQRRTRKGLLHQGSIQGISQLSTLDSFFRDYFQKALADRFSAEVIDRQFTEDELLAAGLVAETKYDSESWTERC